MAQDGTKSPCKCEAFFLVHRNLYDSLEKILDRVLDGDKLVFLGVDLVNGGVQRRCLSAPRRACHQDHAVGGSDRPPESSKVLGFHAERIEVQALRTRGELFFCQDADYCRFSERTRQD